jgi:exopolyphosphatase / guanosine-5'-triphosphate,3'-diphosphate pyrophosphatase
VKFAAIDIGSNAVRLLFCNVYEKKTGPLIKKSSLIRLPIRLGEDVFSSGNISEAKTEKLINAMQAFKNLMEVHNVVKYKACATSAMREATNGQLVVEKVKERSGLDIEIIDGETEAKIIFSTHLVDKLNDKKSYLYIDVGGGSTELTVYSKGKRKISHSFNIGTIRMIQNNDMKEEFTVLKDWIKKNLIGVKNITAIGTGGNINKLLKMSGKKSGKFISYDRLRELDEYLNKFSFEERVETLGLNTDRADVIVQASKIFLTILKTSGIKKIMVPQIGLSDGIIKILYEEYLQEKTEALD